MRSNYTQILAEAIKVAATTDAVSRYGRAKETAYQIMKRSKQLKRSLEAIMLSGQAAVVGNSATARKMASYQAQITTALGLDPHTGGAGTAMTEALFLTTLQSLYAQGVNPMCVSVPVAEAQVIPAYAAASGRQREIETSDRRASKTIVNAVDLYVSPYGEVKVILNRFQLATDYLIYDPAMWKRVTLQGRNWTREPLAKIGDSDRQLIVGEFSLRHLNFAGSAYVRKAV